MDCVIMVWETVEDKSEKEIIIYYSKKNFRFYIIIVRTDCTVASISDFDGGNQD